MFDVGGGELLLIVLVVILLFGPKKIPEVAQQVGKGIRQFRRAQEDLKQQIRDISAEISVEQPQASAPTPLGYSPADQIVAAPNPSAKPDASDSEEPTSEDVSQQP